MKILAIYDAGEDATIDRLTVITNVTELNAASRDIMHYLGCDAIGGTAVSQWGEIDTTDLDLTKDNHLGKRVSFESLNDATQRHLARRILTDEEN